MPALHQNSFGKTLKCGVDCSLHCLAFVVIFFLKERITARSAEVVLDFIKAVQTRTIPYIIYNYQRGAWPCIFIEKCEASFSMVNINPDLYSIVQINCCPAKDHQHLGYPAASFSNLTNELLQEDKPNKIWILHACTKYSLIFKILYYFSVSVFSKQEKWVKNNNMHPKIQLPFNISTFRHVALFHMERG